MSLCCWCGVNPVEVEQEDSDGICKICLVKEIKKLENKGERYLTVLFKVDGKVMRDYADENGTPSEEVCWNELMRRAQQALQSTFSHEIRYGEIEVSAEEWLDSPVEREQIERIQRHENIVPTEEVISKIGFTVTEVSHGLVLQVPEGKTGKETFIKGFGDKLPMILTRACGGRHLITSVNEVPEESLPCTCGDPEHFFIKYQDAVKRIAVIGRSKTYPITNEGEGILA